MYILTRQQGAEKNGEVHLNVGVWGRLRKNNIRAFEYISSKSKSALKIGGEKQVIDVTKNICATGPWYPDSMRA